MEVQSKRRGSQGPTGSRRGSRRGSALNLDESQLEDMISRLKKENHDLRVERNDARKEKEELKIQLKTALDKLKILKDGQYTDDDLLKQLQRARADQRKTRKQNIKLRSEAIRLKGIGGSLIKKLAQLAQQLDDEGYKDMAKKIRDQDTAPKMIDTLADNVFLMLAKIEKLEKKS